MSRNLIARLIVAAIAIPAILWICYEGGWWLFGMFGLFATVGALEFLVAEGYSVRRPSFWWTLFATVGCYLLMASVGPDHDNKLGSIIGIFSALASSMTVFVIVLLVGGMVFAIGRSNPSALFGRYTRLLWGVAYVGVLYGVVYHLGVFHFERLLIPPGDRLLFLFALLWVGDTAAMWGGKAFGKHKLAPTVSPNKTVEGFISGIVGALVIGVVMYFWKLDTLPWYQVLVIAFGASVFGQLGDLVESMWKRSLDIKDSSAIIPGHGGVLDRFDSLLFAAPFMLFYMILIDTL
ncbi:hypothetical protein GF377_09985 [candidate division GN15 bacterium]|nr:hypothetical protein [candidate division GN15 bacterium]